MAPNGNAFDRNVMRDADGDVMYDVMMSDKQYYMENSPNGSVDREDKVIQVV